MTYAEADIVGRSVRDISGTVVGRATAWYQYPQDLDVRSGVAAVRTGRLMRSTHLVDLIDASVDDQNLNVAYPSELIGTAPYYTPMVGNTLGHEHAAAVLAHYRASMAPA
jgi:hypothetical protein